MLAQMWGLELGSIRSASSEKDIPLKLQYFLCCIKSNQFGKMARKYCKGYRLRAFMQHVNRSKYLAFLCPLLLCWNFHPQLHSQLDSQTHSQHHQMTHRDPLLQIQRPTQRKHLFPIELLVLVWTLIIMSIVWLSSRDLSHLVFQIFQSPFWR